MPCVTLLPRLFDADFPHYFLMLPLRCRLLFVATAAAAALRRRYAADARRVDSDVDMPRCFIMLLAA